MKYRHPLFQSATIAAVMAMVAAAAPVHAQDHESNHRRTSRSHGSIEGEIVDVQVRVDGAQAPLYYRPRQFDRHYFQAFKGREYSLMLRNTTGRRVGVLIAVDGLNVVNGEKSSLNRNEPMYVLDPYEHTVIRGWRTSLDDVRKFVFVDEERSYAERTGQANGDMGWIRVAAFKENVPAWSPWGGKVKERTSGDFDRELRSDAAPEPTVGRDAAGKAQAAPEMSRDALGQRQEESNSSPGTGWGEHRNDPVRRTWFEAQRNATDLMSLRYEYAGGLIALGIRPGRSRLWERENGQLGFARTPRW